MEINEFEKNEFVTVINDERIENSDLSIYHWGFSHSKNDDNPIWHKSTYNLHFIVNGSLYFWCNGNKIKLSKNTCFLLSPGSDTYYKINEKNLDTHYWVTFYGKEVLHFLQMSGINLQKPFVKLNPSSAKKIRKIFFSNFTIPQESQMIKEVIFNRNFFEILEVIFQNTNIHFDNNQSNNQKANYIDKTLEYIKNHYTEEDCNLKTIAKYIFVHPNYLSTLFKQTMKTNFKDFINEKRIHLAITLIKNGMNSVTEIAEKVGIPDTSYFTKVFKKYNTITPTQEIKKYLKQKGLSQVDKFNL